MNELYGGIEFGGTKTICAVGHANGQITAQDTFPTTTVEDTLNRLYEFFEKQGSIKALGVGSFGPLNIHRQSSNFGSIYNSPKAGSWANVKLKGLLESHFDVPIEFDLDVNCAALGELNFGVSKEVNSFVYLTLGTGIGGALVIDKQIVHGILNLEMGHMRIPHEPFNDGFKGTCDFHGDCFEGIASGSALQQHYGQKPEEIDASEVWDLEANYVAAALNNIVLIIGPEKIVLGGGLVQHADLIERVRSKLNTLINGYMPIPNLNNYIVKSSGEANGVLGAIKTAASF